mgnify:FL=1|tara:strand:- start:1138 stop:1689 length:552 start_codon:yes stop_codon:yes gene_type:complete
MSENFSESLSALLDDEADDLELRRLLKSCDSNPGIKETWERYNLVQGLMHNDAIIVSKHLSERISEQLAVEPVPSQPHFANWQQGFTKVVIAASVAVILIVFIQSNLHQSPSRELAVQDIVTSSVPELTAENLSIKVDPQAQQLLEDYISRIEIDEEQPLHVEHIQDSPLFRLVNELQDREGL